MTTGVRPQPRGAARRRTTRWSRPALLAVVVGTAGVAYRCALLLADTPRTNSDEATMGLAALRIARGDDFPVFFYGQAYMGTLEAYLAAPLVALAGPSWLALRLPLLALYALFLFLSWRLARRLGGDRWFALLVVGVLAFGSDRIVKNQLIAGGGYPELNPIGVGLALLTLDLAAGRPDGRRWRYAGFGFLAGLAVWVDPLLLPYVLALGAVLVGTGRVVGGSGSAAARGRGPAPRARAGRTRWPDRGELRGPAGMALVGGELRGPAGMALAGGALLGAAPLLAHSLAHGHNPVTAVLAASGADAAASWADRLHGGLVLGPALGLGFCAPGHCATWQLWWSLALPVLLTLAGLSAWRALRGPASAAIPRVPPAAGPDGATSTAFKGSALDDRLRMRNVGVSNPTRCHDLPQAESIMGGPTASAWPASERNRRAGAAVRLALVAGAVGTLAAYTLSSSAGRTPVESSRYLSCLLISIPALLWPLWAAARRPARPGSSGTSGTPTRRPPTVAVVRAAAVGVLGAVLAGAAVATAGTLTTVPENRAEARRHAAMVGALRAHGVRHVHGEYWTCNRLTFAAGEEIICAVVDDRLRPGFDRLPGYGRAVARAGEVAYVAPVGSPLAATLDRQPPPGAAALTVAGWRIWLPPR
ncbi:hypothetical protein E1193_31200 [Micromonospora sp. KC606]|uniref:hypothetical protein n=1 Tax=Micromonospora sp. KC606 TaxID=2530379 RepID=UPI001042DE91|nr:hypothetical protein [Micromonospora sp. KC606]TDC68416.1 hypothetical protein E1193_31200 [Micromonospora sp. KC606]